jgi:hypothetical protein
MEDQRLEQLIEQTWPAHQQAVKRLAAALRELQAARQEEEAVREAKRAGYRV